MHRSSQSSTHCFLHRLLQSSVESSRQSSSESSTQSSFQGLLHSFFESYVRSCGGSDPYPWFAGPRFPPNLLTTRALDPMVGAGQTVFSCIGFSVRPRVRNRRHRDSSRSVRHQASHNRPQTQFMRTLMVRWSAVLSSHTAVLTCIIRFSREKRAVFLTRTVSGVPLGSLPLSIGFSNACP